MEMDITKEEMLQILQDAEPVAVALSDVLEGKNILVSNVALLMLAASSEDVEPDAMKLSRFIAGFGDKRVAPILKHLSDAHQAAGEMALKVKSLERQLAAAETALSLK